jgi:uncharacterized protein (TIGR02246 family)
MNAIEVAYAFVEAINARDPDRMAGLMTEGHAFVDCDGSEHPGREEMREGWRGYFAMVPDFRIRVDHASSQGNTVALFGWAEGTFDNDGVLADENHWHVPAAWRVVVEGDLVAVWQLYVDPTPMVEIHARIHGS